MEYTVKRSARKTVSVEITADAEVLVRAPKAMSRKALEEFLEDHEEWIRTHLERRRQKRDAEQELSPEDVRCIREEALPVLSEKAAYYGRRMGVRPAGIRVTSAKTRFGSCSGKNHICFSWRLMLYPEEVVDYVVVHELAHILHKNHGAAFYRAVAEILPDYRERIKLLKG